IDAQDLATPVVPFTISVGNGYASGGNGTWNGTFTLFGVTLEPDCNDNGIADGEEIASGSAFDCNENDIIDSCEIADGSAADINFDGILDECQETLKFNVPGGFGTIAEAIDAAPDGSIISLAPGVYNEGVDFGAKNLVLEGDPDDPSSVILDGAGLEASVVAITGGQDATTIVRGLTIANGELGSPLPGQPTSRAGGGIFVNNSTPIIEHCRFIDNTSGFGGGVYLRYSDAMIRAVEFIGNRATTDGGALFVFDSAAEIREVEMLENASTNHGGAVKVVYGETSFVDCDMFENQSFEGGGVYWFGGPDVPPLVIDGCSIQGNTAMRQGGGIKTRLGYPGVTLSASVICENLPDQIAGNSEDLGGNCLEELCIDSDADGTIDCFDACPDDPNKIDPGACGCGNPETDANGDGVPDCVVGTIDSGLVWSSPQGGNGHLYSQVSFNTGVTWVEARAYAISLGANLVSFDNDAESIAVKTYLTEQDVSRGWIGLYQDVAAPDYAEPAGGWRWSDGTEYAYVDWLPGEPSNSSIDGATEDFGMLSAPGNQPPLGWNDKAGRLAWAMLEWSEDCDGNGIVDRIEILAGGDCNGNGELDACDVLSGISEDVNRNLAPDECEDTLTFSVPGGFDTIAEAIDTAPSGSIISLAAGTYNEAVDFGAKNLILQGDASNPASVVLDGTGLETSVVSVVDGQDSSSMIIGVTIANGSLGSPLPGQPTSRIGGGLFIRDASPLIQDCIFESNTSGFGGAVYVLNGAAIIDHCDFVENSATSDGGAIFAFGSGGRISNCRLESNTALNHGGGVKVVLGVFRIIDTEITGNTGYQGGGLYWFANADTLPLRVTGCAITGNTANKVGGGIKSRVGFPGVDLMDTTVCDNNPDEIDGEYIDNGGNTLCLCVADFTGDGFVSGADLGLLLGAWGACNPDTQCFADLTGDGFVTGADLGLLLGAWGVCVDP
ncbi:MAG: lectin-like protein, partial [Phycisphaerales bacterium]|nr:lectin-like protein [Phycisphaerales bacterium]